MRGDRVFYRKISIARLTPGDAFIPTRSLSLPSRPYGKRSSPRSFRRTAASSAGACVTPPITPAWLQSPEHLRRPGDFRSHCHAPARLWPPEPSTDLLDLTHNKPARGARLFQTGAGLVAESTGEIGFSTPCEPWNKQIVPSAYKIAVCHLCKLAFRKIALCGAGDVLNEHLVPELCGFQKLLREFLVTCANLRLYHLLYGSVQCGMSLRGQFHHIFKSFMKRL